MEQYGASLDLQNKTGNTALHYALHYGPETELGPYLIEKGASDTILNAVGLTCYDGQGQDERKRLRESTGDPNAGLANAHVQDSGLEGSDEDDSQVGNDDSLKDNAVADAAPSMLTEAKITGTDGVAGEQHESKGGSHIVAEYDSMPVRDSDAAFGAASEGNASVLVKMLDDRFVDCSVTDTDARGNTYLLATARGMMGQDNVFKYQGLMLSLLNRKSAINHANMDGNTALHFAYQYDESGSVAAFLIEKGADDTRVNNVGLTCYDGVTLADTLKESSQHSGAADNFW